VKREEDILRRLTRRLKSARASVMLEFALFAPLIVTTAIFAADFTRILRTEQQLEIAARLGADLEAHLADYYGDEDRPGATTKLITKSYLVDIAKIGTHVNQTYMKAKYDTIKNPLSVLAHVADELLKGKSFDGDGQDSVTKAILKILGKVLGGIGNVLSFRTFNYITDVASHDRQVGVTVAAYVPTVLPLQKFYSRFSLPTRQTGKIGVGQFTEDLEGNAVASMAGLKLNEEARHRVYCHMPVVDAVPVAPKTYVRILKSWLASQPLLKGLLDL
jgi:hypothetical protein